MCRSRRQYRHYPVYTNPMNMSLISGLSPLARERSSRSVDNVIDAIHARGIRSDMVEQPQYRNQVPVYTDQPAPEYTHDAKQAVPSHNPPAYEKVAADNTAGLAGDTIPVTPKGEKGSILLTLPSQYQTTPELAKLLLQMSVAVTAYQAGTGGRRHVRKARKELRDELYDSEVARRAAMNGPLRCGEKCELWKNIKHIDFGY